MSVNNRMSDNVETIDGSRIWLLIKQFYRDLKKKNGYVMKGQLLREAKNFMLYSNDAEREAVISTIMTEIPNDLLKL